VHISPSAATEELMHDASPERAARAATQAGERINCYSAGVRDLVHETTVCGSRAGRSEAETPATQKVITVDLSAPGGCGLVCETTVWRWRAGSAQEVTRVRFELGWLGSRISDTRPRCAGLGWLGSRT